MLRSACRGAAYKAVGKRDVFFPGRGETSEEAITKFCIYCKVRPECKQYADDHDIEVGIWGGERRNRSNGKADT